MQACRRVGADGQTGMLPVQPAATIRVDLLKHLYVHAASMSAHTRMCIGVYLQMRGRAWGQV